MHRRLVSLFLATVTLVLVLDFRAIGAVHSDSSRAYAQPAACQTFPETGKSVCGRFLTYWKEHGGLAQQGYPISAEFVETSEVNGKQYTVQYFERAVFEAHPENAPPYHVLLSLLGSLYFKQRYPNGVSELPLGQPAPPSRVFPETGKRVDGLFLDYWQKHGGLAQQGYPISNPLREKSALDGKEYIVQYFERAVFELHLQNAPPYNVLLSQLGTFQFKRKYPNGEPGADMWATLRQRPLKLPTISPGSPCPTTPGRVVNEGFGLALGDGPVYPVGFGPEGTYYYGGGLEEGGWYYLKVLWVGSPDYRGPALVRGHQVDGANDMRFERGADPPSELQLDPGNSNGGPGQSGWSDWPTYTRLRAPGCYAYQVDGTGLSKVIIFKALDASPPPPGP